MNGPYRTSIVACVLLASTVMAPQLLAQSRQEKREARNAESAKPRQVPGGITFQVKMTASDAFDAVLKQMQLNNVTLDESTKKDLGQMISEMEIVDVGGFRNNNKGYRTYVTFIKEGDALTTVRVNVTVQQRTKHLQAEPWSDPKVDDERTIKLADALKSALGAS